MALKNTADFCTLVIHSFTKNAVIYDLVKWLDNRAAKKTGGNSSDFCKSASQLRKTLDVLTILQIGKIKLLCGVFYGTKSKRNEKNVHITWKARLRIVCSGGVDSRTMQSCRCAFQTEYRNYVGEK